MIASHEGLKEFEELIKRGDGKASPTIGMRGRTRGEV